MAKSVGGQGGKGATALPPSSQTQIGFGGVGGNGGGGGGGAGFSITGHRVSNKNAYTGTVNFDTLNNADRNGTGGDGSNGGDGAPGCVLIYYRVYRASSTGRLITRDGKGFNEKFTRKVVV